MERYEWNEDLSIDVAVADIGKFPSRNKSKKHHRRQVFLNLRLPLIHGNPRFRQ